MIITPATIAALQTTFSSIYRSAWDATVDWGSRVATTVPSSTRSNTYGWMKRLPSLRKWLGPRLIQNLSAHKYELTNEPYELTVGVDRDDIEDDNLGVYNPIIGDMARSARKWPDQLLKTILQGGTSGLGFDGVAFFASTHALDPAGNQSNNFTGTALSDVNFGSVRAAMGSYKGEDGEPLGVMPQLLIVPPQLEDTANKLVTAEYGANGATNVQRGQASVLVIPELANQATTWYLADVSRPIKPLIFQNRKAPEMVSKTAPTDDNVFHQRQFLWGVDARGAAGYGPWFLMARAIA
ncbi:MAG: Mu-like prophage major head subunit gpT family protein [Polyangiaceae bacterium]|nr:Mu-like prophage major head subunit gpT family protein [Polyangiaceae bacterium]